MKNLIVAGVTTDVCLVPPALSMQGEGFHIKVCPSNSAVSTTNDNPNCSIQCVVDAGGSPTNMVEQIAWERLKQAGVPLASTNAIVTELIKDWSTEAGQIAFPLLA